MMRPVCSEAESNLTLRGASARLLRMMFVKLVRCGIAFALLIFVAAAPVRADVYAYTDEHGVAPLRRAARCTLSIIDLSVFHYTVRAELVEALLPFDKLRANGLGLSRIMERSIVLTEPKPVPAPSIAPSVEPALVQAVIQPGIALSATCVAHVTGASPKTPSKSD